MKIVIIGKTSNEARKRALIETGKPISQQVSWSVSLAELPRDARAALVEYIWGDEAPAQETTSSTTVHLEDFIVKPSGSVASVMREVDPDADPIEEVMKTIASRRQAYEKAQGIALERLERWMNETLGLIARLRRDEGLRELELTHRTSNPRLPAEIEGFVRLFNPDLAEEARRLDEELRREWDAAKQREEERRKAREEQIKAEELAWIDEFGSEHLKAIVRCGYDYGERYLSERLERELPGFEYAEEVSWSRASSPSEEALYLAEQVGGEVVETYDDDEAVVVRRPWMRGAFGIRIVG